MKKWVLIYAAVFAGMLALPTSYVSPGYAQVDVNINIGGRRRGITCSQGRRIVERRGFRNVRAIDCRGDTFRYSGRRRGDSCRIDVRRRNGQIVGTRCR